MPELPEVQTTVSGLNRAVTGLVINDVWTEYNSPYYHGGDTIKDPTYFKYFKKTIKGSKVTGVTRRAKNILIHLSNNHTILIHMKMTGHVMYGNYNKKDPFNKHIRLIFYLSNGKTMELCDTRKFAKVTLLPSATMHETAHLKDLGPEPLEKDFTFKVFKKVINKKSTGKIKLVLMDQSVVAGIGNIYADESLHRASIHPESLVENIPEKSLKELYKAILSTLKMGIDFGGDSMSDYRNIDGERGKFQEKHMAYRRTGKPCLKMIGKIKCRGEIERTVVRGRGTHFCRTHQVEY
jgi:formamidopyrimidine-DNA glycosylase